MTKRTFDLQVSGYTQEGYGFTLSTREVESDKLDVSLKWIGEKMAAAGVLPSIPEVGPARVDPPGWPDTKICPIHKEEMTRHEKGKSHWWSHKVISEDGSETWCRGK